MKPVIIYVSGSPGSGKTTLAKLLSDQLYLPHISSDLIHGGVEFTQPNHDRKIAIESTFVPLMVGMAQKNISFVVDHVLQKHIAKSSIIDALLPHANVINVHTQTSDPIERYVHRIKASTLPDIIRRRNLLLERAEYHRNNLVNTADVIDLDIPKIVVNTDNGYDPSLDNILNFVQNNKNESVLLQ